MKLKKGKKYYNIQEGSFVTFLGRISKTYIFLENDGSEYALDENDVIEQIAKNKKVAKQKLKICFNLELITFHVPFVKLLFLTLT